MGLDCANLRRGEIGDERWIVLLAIDLSLAVISGDHRKCSQLRSRIQAAIGSGLLQLAP